MIDRSVLMLMMIDRSVTMLNMHRLYSVPKSLCIEPIIDRQTSNVLLSKQNLCNEKLNSVNADARHHLKLCLVLPT